MSAHWELVREENKKAYEKKNKFTKHLDMIQIQMVNLSKIMWDGGEISSDIVRGS